MIHRGGAMAAVYDRRFPAAMRVAAALVFAVCALALLAGCGPDGPKFKASDITGSSFGRDFALTDHTGKPRTLADFRGKAVVMFFGSSTKLAAAYGVSVTASVTATTAIRMATASLKKSVLGSLVSSVMSLLILVRGTSIPFGLTVTMIRASRILRGGRCPGRMWIPDPIEVGIGACG